MKERITLTIDKDILEKIDSRVNGAEIKNRSHAVELLLLKALSANRLRKGVILAGGSTKSDDKHIGLLEVVQDKTILEWNIKLLKRHGVKEIMLCVGDNAETIKQHFGDGEKVAMKLLYNEEKFPLGTAGSIKAVKDFVNETTIVCSADDLKKIDLDDMYEFHKNNNRTCTMALTTVDNPSNFGVALLNGNRIVTFVEKPSKENAPSNLINAGLYIIEPDIIKYIPDGYSVIEQDVFPKLAKEDNLIGYIFSGQWLRMKTAEDLEYARKEWKGIK